MKFTRFEKITLGAALAIIFLIGIGALVRVTGSGLGCPDWPHCYGRWMPPTDVSQIPPQFDPAQFNVAKTWTEYLNRWAGVITGFLVLAMFVSSLQFRKTQKKIFLLSIFSLILVAFNGWLGGVVVKSELVPHIITYHMILAFLLLGVVLFALYSSLRTKISFPAISPLQRKKFLFLGILLLVTSILQIITGTEVREVTDIFIKAQTAVPRAEWLDHSGIIYPIHRSSAWLVLILGGYIFYLTLKEKFPHLYKISSAWIMAFILLQVFTGIFLQNFSLPPAFQILHLLNSSLLFCAELVFLFMLFERKNSSQTKENFAQTESVELSA